MESFEYGKNLELCGRSNPVFFKSNDVTNSDPVFTAHKCSTWPLNENAIASSREGSSSWLRAQIYIARETSGNEAAIAASLVGSSHA